MLYARHIHVRTTLLAGTEKMVKKTGGRMMIGAIEVVMMMMEMPGAAMVERSTGRGTMMIRGGVKQWGGRHEVRGPVGRGEGETVV